MMEQVDSAGEVALWVLNTHPARRRRRSDISVAPCEMGLVEAVADRARMAHPTLVSSSVTPDRSWVVRVCGVG